MIRNGTQLSRYQQELYYANAYVEFPRLRSNL